MSVSLVKETSLYLQEINLCEDRISEHVRLFLLQLYSSKEWCQFLMGVWVWLRSVNVWSTLFLSAFHLQTLRRVAPTMGTVGPRGLPKNLLLTLAFIWLLNFFYSIPAHIFSTNGDMNSTEVRACC